MRYGIFSDVHSNLEALEAVLNAFKNEAIDTYLCVGDTVGYGANPKECIEQVQGITKVSVAGNHDWASVGLFSTDFFNPIAAKAVTWTKHVLGEKENYFLGSLKLVYKNQLFTLVHGTLDNPQDFNYLTDGYLAAATFNFLETDICFVGHTHIPGIFVKDNNAKIEYREEESCDIEPYKKYIINVGSVGQPRDGNPKAAYCVYDTQKKEARIKRTDYDVQLARKKIIESGLPKLLGDRLLSGR